MKRRKWMLVFAGSMLVWSLVLPVTVQAGESIDTRQEQQHQRIQDGIADGSLTPNEVEQLEREQGRIQAKEDLFRSDGVLTHRERGILHRDLDRASRHIYRQRHDRQHR